MNRMNFHRPNALNQDILDIFMLSMTGETSILCQHRFIVREFFNQSEYGSEKNPFVFALCFKNINPFKYFLETFDTLEKDFQLIVASFVFEERQNTTIIEMARSEKLFEESNLQVIEALYEKADRCKTQFIKRHMLDMGSVVFAESRVYQKDHEEPTV